ncbi:prepilin-type N-terminal cleavage/methylation domain-containing protein [Candidatus Dojkabacteria bacterium]|nr:prepilin-type N-terminal cleavage/methylation domain-containing protein [Candidatus Dojkabacteria bacterium]
MAKELKQETMLRHILLLLKRDTKCKLTQHDKKRSAKREMRYGFTLLELLLVIAIIAVLAGIIMFSLKPADRLREANQTKYLSNANDLEKAFNSYVVDNGGNLPTAFNSLTYGYYDICRQGQSGSCVSLDELVTSGKMSSIPVDSDKLTATTTGFKVKYDPIRKEAIVYSNAEYTSRIDSGTTLTEGLVGWWKMDETSWNGTAGEVKDSSGRNNNGSAVGGISTIGKFENGGSFTSANYHNIPDSNDFDTVGSLTLTAWIKTGHSGTAQHIIGRANYCGTPCVRYSMFVSTGGYLQAYVGDGTGAGLQSAMSTSLINDNNWHHVSVVFDKIFNKIIFYIDGQKNNEVTLTKTGSYSSTDNILIGGSAPFGFIGSIDEVRVYSKVLNIDEMESLYNWAPSPVTHWKFDEGTGSSANDSSGNGNNGTLTNGPTWVTGKYGNALNFISASSSFVRAPITNDNKLNIRGAISYSAWYKRNTNTGYQTLIDMIDNCGTVETDGYFLRFYDSTLVFYSAINDVAGQDPFSFGYTNIAQTGDTTNWHHVAVTWDGTTSANAVKMYLDGVMVSQATANSTAANMSTLVGSYLSAGVLNCNAHAFDGKIDDVRIYNYARTQAQVVNDMNNL